MGAWELSATELRDRVSCGDISAVESTTEHLRRIDEVDRDITAFVAVDSEEALRQAEGLDIELAAGRPVGPLHGVPVAVKDCFHVAGLPTRLGSRVFDEAPPAAHDSAVVTALRRSGAVIIGKTATHELAAGVSTPSTNNPWDRGRSAGGSSGGSAAAVAAHLAGAAVGSDSLGSVRLPAAYCGVVGLKPTYGSLPTTGMVPLSWSLDHVGLLTRTVGDAQLMFESLRRAPAPAPHPSGVVGVLAEGLEEIDGVAREVVWHARAVLQTAGVEVRDVRMEDLRYALPAAYAILMAEAATTHRRLVRDQGQQLGGDVRPVLDAGMALPAVTYLTAQHVRRHLCDLVRGMFAAHGLVGLLGPIVPGAAHRHGQERTDVGGRSEPLAIACVRPNVLFNLTGQPSVAVPMQLSGEGLPLAVQIATRPGDEATAFRLAHLLEAAGGRVTARRRQLAVAASERRE